MNRLTLLALVTIAACAKGKEAPLASGGAPAEGSAAPTTGGASGSVTPSPTTATPPVAPGANAEPPPPAPDNKPAIEHARDDSSLGPTTDPTLFEPIGSGGGGDRKKLEQPRGGKGGTGAPEKVAPPKVAPEVRVVAITGADGKAAPAVLDQALRTRLSEVKACYDKYPGSTGSLALTFTVTAAGALTSATVKTSTVKKIELEACVIGVVQTIKLPKPIGPADTKATVTFEK